MSTPQKPSLVFEYDSELQSFPTNASDAKCRLEEGNKQIAAFWTDCENGGSGTAHPVPLSPRQIGLDIPRDDLGFPQQAPWAVFLGCSDARVPAELLFGQGFNDIFSIRVAGNVLGDSEEASLTYALNTFAKPKDPSLPRLLLVVVLGHRGCGAVKAVVEHYQGIKPHVTVDEAISQLGDCPLDNLMRQIYPAFKVAAAEVDEPWEPSNLEYLVERTVYLNAAMTASRISATLPQGVRAAHGVYDPLSFKVFAIEDAAPKKRPSWKAGDAVEGRTNLQMVP